MTRGPPPYVGRRAGGDTPCKLETCRLLFYLLFTFGDFVYTGGPLPPKVWREALLGPITLGVAWFYVGYRTVHTWRRRRLQRVQTVTA